MYRINDEMLGSDGTNEGAMLMVEFLREAGYDVEFTYDTGAINYREECPFPDSVWDSCLKKLRSKL